MTLAEWSTQPDPLPELSLDVAAAFVERRWSDAAAGLARGADIARAAAHPASAEWGDAAALLAAYRAEPTRPGGEALRSAIVGLCGGEGSR
jgi:hypothetical protein